MDLQAVFERIGYRDGGTETERLFRLHRAYCTHIPYENLEVFNGGTVDLRPEKLFDKIVTRRRGGYCFEMNGFFYAIAREMGFKGYGLLTRLSRDGKPYGSYVHRTNLMQADGARYLCDVGCGKDGFIVPLRFELNVDQENRGRVYRIVPGIEPSVEYSVLIRREDGFQPYMGFINRPAHEEDFALSSFYMNYSPDSGFRKMIMMNRFTETGRYSMMNLNLTHEDGDRTETREVPWAELPAVLKSCFGLDVVPNHVPEPLEKALPAEAEHE